MKHSSATRFNNSYDSVPEQGMTEQGMTEQGMSEDGMAF
jgi:hypothetical protein